MHQFPTPLDWWRTARVWQGYIGSDIDQRPTRADDGIEQKAYHEAAHAAFAWHFGHPLQHVKIGDAEGASNAGFDPLINPTPEQCQQRALVCLAGEAAWATVCGIVEMHFISRTTDWAKAKGWCEQSDPDGDAANQALTLLGRAQALAWHLAPAIQALADVLLTNREIDPVAACGLLATAMQQASGDQYDKR